MVLKGGIKGYSIPLNAPLYPTGTPIVYYGCKVLLALALVEKDSIDPILPEGVNPASEKPLTAFWVAYYPISNVGEYFEALIAVQVSTEEQPLAYYIPYIYVTNDQALASGRELLGAPKKIAGIRLSWEHEVLKGEVLRGSKIMEVTLQPREKGDISIVKSMIPEEIPLLSIRTLPPLPGYPGLAQLVKWHARILLGENPRILVGPADIKLRGTPADPIDHIRVDTILTGFYLEFDMELHVDGVLREWRLG